MTDQSRIVPITNDTVDIPVVGMFASADWRVISRNGENYYQSCGETVLAREDGSSTHCVKPIHHITWQHEDFEGRVTDGLGGVIDIDTQIRNRARAALKRTGLDEEQVYNVLNALFYDGVNLVKGS